MRFSLASPFAFCLLPFAFCLSTFNFQLSTSAFLAFPRQLPSFLILIERRQRHRFPELLELIELPELRVLPERVIRVHSDGDQPTRSVEETEVEYVIAQNFAERMADDVSR